MDNVAGADSALVPTLTGADCEAPIHSRWDTVVSRATDRAAVCCDGVVFTYAEVDRRARAEAAAVDAACSGSAAPLALLLDERLYGPEAILAAAFCGKPWVVLDPKLPSARLARILEDSGADCVLATPAVRERAIRDLGAPAIVCTSCPDEGNPGWRGPRTAPTADSIACLLYTSGSTGRPKGVVHSHRTIQHVAVRQARALELTSADRSTMISTPGHVAGLADLLRTLLHGATLYPFDSSRLGFPELAALLARERVTLFHSIPRFFREFCRSLPEPLSLPDLRWVQLDGAPSTRRDVELFRDRLEAPARLLVNFGCTELSTYSYICIGEEDEVTTSVVPIGTPPPEAQVTLIGPDGTAVPEGEIGEIVVRSRYLAMGYWQRPEATMQAFGEVISGDAVRVFRSGDMAQWVTLAASPPRRVLCHRGRADHQVKVLGHRVELGEIEATLLRNPHIREAVVTASAGADGDTRLTACVVPDGEQLADDACRTFLRAHLPEYMVPHVFHVVDKLPETATGKLDRRAVERHSAGESVVESPVTSPADDDALSCIEACYAELLPEVAVDAETDFFQAGGDSLLGMRLVAELGERLGVPISPALLAQWRTPADLARALTGVEHAALRNPVVLQPGSPRRLPLYLVPPAGVGVSRFGPLAQALAGDQPVIGFHHDGLEPGTVSQDRIDAIASRYTACLEESARRGRCVLGGQCFGAMVAYRMGCRIAAAGHPAPPLLVLGMMLPPGWRPTPLHYVRRLIHLACNGELTAFAARALRGNPELTGVDRAAVERIRVTRAAHARARWQCERRPYPGPIILVWATGATRIPDYLRLWKTLAEGGVRVVEVGGSHASMLAWPRVAAVGERVQAELDVLAASGRQRGK